MNTNGFTRARIASLAICLGASVNNVMAVTDITFCDEINQPGSYRVTQNLASQSSPQCLLIDASNVVLDLQGHTITGDGSPTSRGIADGGARYVNVEVRNGAITKFGTGIDLSNVSGARVERMRVFDSSATGVRVGGAAIVSSNLVGRTAGNGIATGAASSIFDNLILTNRGAGIAAERQGHLVRNNIVVGNRTGITAGCPSLISDNTSTDNRNGERMTDIDLPDTSGCKLVNNATTLK